MEVDVYYIDTLEGGSGCSRVKLLLLPVWLVEHPGYLIRELRHIHNISMDEEMYTARKRALTTLGERLIRRY